MTTFRLWQQGWINCRILCVKLKIYYLALYRKKFVNSYTRQPSELWYVIELFYTYFPLHQIEIFLKMHTQESTLISSFFSPHYGLLKCVAVTVSSLAPLPCFILRYHQFHPELLIHHWCKQQVSEKSKQYLNIIMRIVLASQSLWKDPRDPTGLRTIVWKPF